MSKLNNYKIIKELGKGGYGVVYLVNNPDNEKNYAMKIEKIREEDIDLDNKFSPLTKELKFNIKVAKKYPNFFMRLLDYDIVKDCDYKWKATEKDNEINKELEKSPYCFRKIYTLVDGVVCNIRNKISAKALKSLIIQFIYTIYIMYSIEKIIVIDIASCDNVGFIKTNKKYISINVNNKTYQIPTYGYLIQIIDYGYISDIEDIEKNIKEYNPKSSDISGYKFIHIDHVSETFFDYYDNKDMFENIANIFDKNFEKVDLDIPGMDLLMEIYKFDTKNENIEKILTYLLENFNF